MRNACEQGVAVTAGTRQLGTINFAEVFFLEVTNLKRSRVRRTDPNPFIPRQRRHSQCSRRPASIFVLRGLVLNLDYHAIRVVCSASTPPHRVLTPERTKINPKLSPPGEYTFVHDHFTPLNEAPQKGRVSHSNSLQVLFRHSQ